MMRILLVLMAFSSSILLAEVPNTAQESTKTPEAKVEAKQPLFIVQFTTGPAWVQGKAFGEQGHAREHSANLQRLRRDGSILVGARYADTGMVILRAESEDRARAEIDGDPAVRSGIFVYTLSELHPFFGGCVP